MPSNKKKIFFIISELVTNVIMNQEMSDINLVTNQLINSKTKHLNRHNALHTFYNKFYQTSIWMFFFFAISQMIHHKIYIENSEWILLKLILPYRCFFKIWSKYIRPLSQSVGILNFQRIAIIWYATSVLESWCFLYSKNAEKKITWAAASAKFQTSRAV